MKFKKGSGGSLVMPKVNMHAQKDSPKGKAAASLKKKFSKRGK